MFCQRLSTALDTRHADPKCVLWEMQGEHGCHAKQKRGMDETVDERPLRRPWWPPWFGRAVRRFDSGRYRHRDRGCGVATCCEGGEVSGIVPFSVIGIVVESEGAMPFNACTTTRIEAMKPLDGDSHCDCLRKIYQNDVIVRGGSLPLASRSCRQF
jgi:hypothetical protein